MLKSITGGARSPGRASSEVAPVAMGVRGPQTSGDENSFGSSSANCSAWSESLYLDWVLLLLPLVKNRPGGLGF